VSVLVRLVGIGTFDETNFSYGGVYAGSSSLPLVIRNVESFDLILPVGSLKLSLLWPGSLSLVPASHRGNMLTRCGMNPQSDFKTAQISYCTSQLNKSIS
jgi:hypothetical protein